MKKDKNNDQNIESLIMVNPEIKCEVRRSTRAKRLNLKVAQDKVRVSVPPNVSYADAKAFVESKRDWIVKHVEAWRSQNLKTARKYETGEYLPFLGQSLPLFVQRTRTKDSGDGVRFRVKVKLSAEGFWLEMPADIPPEAYSSIARDILVKWYRKQAERIFRSRLDHYAGRMGLQYQRLSIREQKTRWGSCSSKKTISLNWRIVLAPEKVMDYLIVHELAHLRQMNHSPAFWSLVETYIPDYRTWRKWLKDNSSTLNID